MLWRWKPLSLNYLDARWAPERGTYLLLRGAHKNYLPVNEPPPRVNALLMNAVRDIGQKSASPCLRNMK